MFFNQISLPRNAEEKPFRPQEKTEKSNFCDILVHNINISLQEHHKKLSMFNKKIKTNHEI